MATTSNKGKPKHHIGGVSKRFKQMSELYRIFATGWDGLDFSDAAMIEMFNSESYGLSVARMNGFYVGKQWLNVTVAMWKEDRRDGHLVLKDLYDDVRFPHWWLNSVLNVNKETQ